MSTLDKLETINDSLNDIKDAVIAKGQTPSGDITTYAAAIENITTGYPYPEITTTYANNVVSIPGGAMPDYSIADAVEGFLVTKGLKGCTYVPTNRGHSVGNPEFGTNDSLIKYGVTYDSADYVYNQLPTTLTNQDWTFEFTIKTPDDPDGQFMRGFRLFSFGPSDGQSGSDDQNWCYVLCQYRGITFNKYGDSIDVRADWIIDDGNTEYTFRIRHDSTEDWYFIEQWDGTEWDIVADGESSESINASYVLAGKSDYSELDDYGLASIYLRDCYMTVGGIRSPAFAADSLEIKDGLLAEGLTEQPTSTDYNVFYNPTNKFVLDTAATKADYMKCSSVTVPVHTVPRYILTNVTMVGSPTVDTKFGSLTDITNSNYMKFSEALNFDNKSWVCSVRFKTSNNVSSEQAIIGEEVDAHGVRFGINGQKLALLVAKDGDWFNDNYGFKGNLTVSANTEYYVRFGCNYSDVDNSGTHTTTWEYFIEYFDNGTWTRDYTWSTSDTVSGQPSTRYNIAESTPLIGVYVLDDSNTTAFGTGIVYLSSLSFKIANVEKFNWHGSLNLTTVGSLTVSDDFIASGFSASNYVTANVTGLPMDGYDVIIKAKFVTNQYNEPSVLFGPCTTEDWCGVWRQNNATGMWFHQDIIGSQYLNNNDKFWYLMRVTSSGAELYILVDNNDQYTVDTLPAISSWTQSATTHKTGILVDARYRIGMNPSNSYPRQCWDGGDIYLDTFVMRDSTDGTIYWKALS